MVNEQRNLALTRHELLQEQLDKLGLFRVWHGAGEWYNQNFNSRKYHNLHHANTVCRAIYDIVEAPSMALLMAAKWHDAVYVPLAGSDANERCSAAALESCYRKLGEFNTPESREIIDTAKNLILKTTVAHHLTDERNVYFPLEAALVDADLSSLATDYEPFIQNQKDIVTENYGIYENDKRKSAEFLKQFLTVRSHIYHTDKARELWESKARANIERYLNETL